MLARAAPRAAIAFAPLARSMRGALASAGLHDVDLAVLGGDAGEATPIEALLALGAGDPYAEPDLRPDDLAAVPFSSGTGGLPKGVRLTHGNLAAAAEQGATAFRAGGDYDERSVVLAGGAVLPLDRPHAHALRAAAPRGADRHPASTRRSSRCWSSSPRTASPTWRCRRRSSTRWPRTRASTSTTCRAFGSSPRAAPTCTRTSSRRSAIASAAWRARATARPRRRAPSALRSVAPARRGPSAGSCPAPRRGSSTRRRAWTSSPESRASCGCAALRSCRAITACPRTPPAPSRPTAGCAPAISSPSATTASSRSATASRS